MTQLPDTTPAGTGTPTPDEGKCGAEYHVVGGCTFTCAHGAGHAGSHRAERFDGTAAYVWHDQPTITVDPPETPLAQRLHRLAGELEQARAENARLRQERDVARVHAAHMESQRDEARERFRTLQGSYASLAAENSRLADDLAEAQESNRARGKRRRELADQVDGLRAALAEVRQQHDTLVAEVERHVKQLDLIVETFSANAAWNGSGLWTAVRNLLGDVRQAIAKTAPPASQDQAEPVLLRAWSVVVLGEPGEPEWTVSGWWPDPADPGTTLVRLRPGRRQPTSQDRAVSDSFNQPLIAMCRATAHDLSTNRPLRCDRPVHDGPVGKTRHRWVFADEPQGPAVGGAEEGAEAGHLRHANGKIDELYERVDRLRIQLSNYAHDRDQARAERDAAIKARDEAAQKVRDRGLRLATALGLDRKIEHEAMCAQVESLRAARDEAAATLHHVRTQGNALADRMWAADPLNRRADRVWAKQLRDLLTPADTQPTTEGDSHG